MDLTIDMLVSKGMNLVDKCILCNNGGESLEHILIICPTAKSLWEYFVPTFKRPWTILATVKEALGKDLFVGQMSPKASWLKKKLPQAIILVIWKERNKRIFEEEVRRLHNLISNTKKLMFSW